MSNSLLVNPKTEQAIDFMMEYLGFHDFLQVTPARNVVDILATIMYREESNVSWDYTVVPPPPYG